MGGRVRLLVCGSAPLAGNVLTFIRCALGCLVCKIFAAFNYLFSNFVLFNKLVKASFNLKEREKTSLM